MNTALSLGSEGICLALQRQGIIEYSAHIRFLVHLQILRHELCYKRKQVNARD
jgi:hypothetical protein